MLESFKTANFYPERINNYERKGIEGTQKDYLLRIDGSVKEGLRTKLGLHSYLEGISTGDSPYLKDKGIHGICEKNLNVKQV